MNLNLAEEFANPAPPEELQAWRENWRPPEGIEVFYMTIPGPEDNPEIRVKVYRPVARKEPLPIIMNVHGGGFVAGDCDADNTRLEGLVMKIPAIAVSIDYRLVPEHVFPAALMDCYAVWNWIHEHAGEIGGNPKKMALYGTSAGANLCAGMAFFIRDHGGQQPALNLLNVPPLGLGPKLSQEQMRFGSLVINGQGISEPIWNYLGEKNGMLPSYYAVPNVARDFSGLPPTFLILAGCDPLRDEGLEYMQHLLEDAVPVEVHMIPGTYHGFNLFPTPTVKMLEEAEVLAYKREFAKGEKKH